MKAKRKTVKKKAAKRLVSRPLSTGKSFRLQKLIDNLAAIESVVVNPCQTALDRVKRALSAQEIAKLKPDLELLEKAVGGCPEDCGCKQGLMRVIISAQGKILGELSSEGGKFSGLFLNGAGEDLLGEEASRLRYVGLKGVPGFETAVQARNPEFLKAFIAWCAEKDCETLVVSEPYLAVWSRLQTANLDESQLLPIMGKLQSVQRNDALRLVDGLHDSPDAGL